MKTKKLLMLALVLGSILPAKAQDKTSFYQFNTWENRYTKTAYVTGVYSFSGPAYREVSHYAVDIKRDFLTWLEAVDDLEKAWDYTRMWSPKDADSKSFEKVSDIRLQYIADLKKEGYTVYHSKFSWKPRDE